MATTRNMPAFTGVGGGAVVDWVDPEAPQLPPMPKMVDAASSAHLEVGSAKLLAWRLSVSTCVINSLCVFLAIGACASPWFGAVVSGGCTLWLGLTQQGQLPGSNSACPPQVASYPAAWPTSPAPDAVVREVYNTLGFSQFLMVWAFFATLLSAVSAGLLANAIIRAQPPRRLGTAFFMNAFTATAFVISALSTVIAVGRYLALWNTDSYRSFARVVGPGQGSANALVVFTCATMACTTVAKLKLRVAAVELQLEKDRAEHAALLGADPEAEGWPQIPHPLRMILC